MWNHEPEITLPFEFRRRASDEGWSVLRRCVILLPIMLSIGIFAFLYSPEFGVIGLIAWGLIVTVVGSLLIYYAVLNIRSDGELICRIDQGLAPEFDADPERRPMTCEPSVTRKLLEPQLTSFSPTSSGGTWLWP